MKGRKPLPFKKGNNSSEILMNPNWSTNGQFLTCLPGDGIMRVFSIKTGKKV
jgi:hypothetical protein